MKSKSCYSWSCLKDSCGAYGDGQTKGYAEGSARWHESVVGHPVLVGRMPLNRTF